MLVDISKLTLENLSTYGKQEKKPKLTQKEYQHKYYMEVTKHKRKLRRLENEQS